MLRIIFKIHVFLNFEIWNPHNYLPSFIDPYLKKKKLIFLDFHKNIGFLKSICCVGVFIHTRWPHNTENLSQNIVYKPRFEASKWYWCFYPRCDWCPWWFEKDPSEINHLTFVFSMLGSKANKMLPAFIAIHIHLVTRSLLFTWLKTWAKPRI